MSQGGKTSGASWGWLFLHHYTLAQNSEESKDSKSEPCFLGCYKVVSIGVGGQN